MFNPVEVLEVRMFGDLVGRLVMAPDFRGVFEYDPIWLTKGFSISPLYMPLNQGTFTARRDPFDGLFGVFNDSLPDGWGNLLLDRILLKINIHPATLSPIDRLSIIGTNGMGALTYHPENQIVKKDELADLNLIATEVDKVLNEIYSDSIEHLFYQGGSSGGARPKVLIRIDGEDWLIKFRSSIDPENIGELEYKYSLMACKCGIEMSETRLFEGRYFGSKRFDRFGTQRFHVHSASGLLYASHRYPSLDYTELLKATMALTRDMDEVAKVYCLMIFNVLVGNMDDHAKNFSFIYFSDRWHFAPAYDLVKSDGFNAQHSTTINGKGNPDKEDIFRVANHVGLSPKLAKRIYEEVKDNVEELT